MAAAECHPAEVPPCCASSLPAPWALLPATATGMRPSHHPRSLVLHPSLTTHLLCPPSSTQRGMGTAAGVAAAFKKEIDDAAARAKRQQELLRR